MAAHSKIYDLTINNFLSQHLDNIKLMLWNLLALKKQST